LLSPTYNFQPASIQQVEDYIAAQTLDETEAHGAFVRLMSWPEQEEKPWTDMGFLAWIVVGLIAGWLAVQVMKGGGYGVLIDIVLGILGAVLGGWIFGMLGIWHGGGMVGSIIVAFVGAVILVWVTRLLKKA
jgi:uncharacterized membrane protein YeaQ/YmgE (transglycosylase-associated protein family)